MRADPPADLARLRRRHALRLVGFLGACGVALYARKPDMFHRPQLWAEDGFIFFQQALTLGSGALVTPYAGYHLGVPRIVAAIAAAFDPVAAPAIYVGSRVALILWVVARTLSPRFPIQHRAVAALAIVFVPDAGEVLLLLTSVQWILAVGLVALLISDDPQTPRQKAHDAIAALLIGTTGPFSTLLAAVFAWRAWVRRSRWSGILAAIVTGSGLVQLSFLIRDPAPLPTDHALAGMHALAAVGARVGGSLLLGAWVPAPPGIVVGSLLGLGTLAAVAWLASRPGPNRPQRLWCGAAFAVLLAAGLLRSRFSLDDLLLPGFGSRYFIPPQILATWLVASLLSEGGRLRRRLVAGVLLFMLVVNLPRLREPELFDLQWERYAEQIRPGHAIVVPINPIPSTIDLPEGW